MTIHTATIPLTEAMLFCKEFHYFLVPTKLILIAIKMKQMTSSHGLASLWLSAREETQQCRPHQLQHFGLFLPPLGINKLTS